MTLKVIRSASFANGFSPQLPSISINAEIPLSAAEQVARANGTTQPPSSWAQDIVGEFVTSRNVTVVFHHPGLRVGLHLCRWHHPVKLRFGNLSSADLLHYGGAAKIGVFGDIEVTPHFAETHCEHLQTSFAVTSGMSITISVFAKIE